MLDEGHLMERLDMRLGPVLRLQSALARKIAACPKCLHCRHCHHLKKEEAEGKVAKKE